MARSADEKAALEALEMAIEAHSTVWYRENPDTDAVRGTVVDWIIITAEIKPDMEDGDNDKTTYGMIYRGGSIPWYRARGLLAAGINRLEANEEDDND
jgi:hypothetical protein